jgi:hypothetical protein
MNEMFYGIVVLGEVALGRRNVSIFISATGLAPVVAFLIFSWLKQSKKLKP